MLPGEVLVQYLGRDSFVNCSYMTEKTVDWSLNKQINSIK